MNRIASLFICVIFAMNLFSVKGERMTCEECGNHFHGDYYCGVEGNEILCEDCAREYWLPFAYQNFRYI